MNISLVHQKKPIICDVFVLSIYPNDVYIIRLLNGMTPKLRHNKSRTTTYLLTIKQKQTLSIKHRKIGIFLSLRGDSYKRERITPQKHYVLLGIDLKKTQSEVKEKSKVLTICQC